METIANRPGDYSYVIGPYREPIATVRPGETFAIETVDAFENKIDSAEADITRLIKMPYVNPLTGPVHVEGAERGDTLAVTIGSIEVTREYAVSALIPEFGGLCSTVFTRTLNCHSPGSLDQASPRSLTHPRAR